MPSEVQTSNPKIEPRVNKSVIDFGCRFYEACTINPFSKSQCSPIANQSSHTTFPLSVYLMSRTNILGKKLASVGMSSFCTILHIPRLVKPFSSTLQSAIISWNALLSYFAGMISDINKSSCWLRVEKVEIEVCKSDFNIAVRVLWISTG